MAGSEQGNSLPFLATPLLKEGCEEAEITAALTRGRNTAQKGYGPEEDIRRLYIPQRANQTQKYCDTAILLLATHPREVEMYVHTKTLYTCSFKTSHIHNSQKVEMTQMSINW